MPKRKAGICEVFYLSAQVEDASHPNGLESTQNVRNSWGDGIVPAADLLPCRRQNPSRLLKENTMPNRTNISYSPINPPPPRLIGIFIVSAFALVMGEAALGQDKQKPEDTESVLAGQCKDAWDGNSLSSCTLSSYSAGTDSSCNFEATCVGANSGGERVSKETSWEGPLEDVDDLVNCNGILKMDDDC